MNSTIQGARDVSINEADKLIRQALESAYPRRKFRIKLDPTAYPWDMIHVVWYNGPSRAEVAALLDPFDAEGFDPALDMLYPRYAWRMDDNRVTFAGTDGTRGSRGDVDAVMNLPPSFPAELVSFDLIRVLLHRYDAQRRSPKTTSKA